MSHNYGYDYMAVVTDGATDYWRLDQDGDCKVNQAFQNASDGGTASLSATSILPAANNNGSTSFDGSTSYVTMTYNQLSQGLSFPSSNHFSVEAWIKPAADQSATDVIGIAQKPGAFGIYLAYGCPTFFIQSNGDTSRTLISSSTAVSSGSIYHIVGVYTPNDGASHGHLYLYVNSSLVADAQCAFGKTIDQSDVTNFTVGSWDTSGEFFNGLISNVALYDSALTSTQVSNHYSYSG